MEITKIVVGHQETANLGDYSNIRPSVTLEVTLTDSDDPAKVLADAQAIVRDAVQREVDDALERNDKKPRYTTEPRYSLLVRHGRREDGLETVVVIAPVGTKLTGLSQSQSGFRLAAIRQQAERHYSDALVIDATIDPEAVQSILDEIAAEDAAIVAERERLAAERQRVYEQQRQQYEQQRAAAGVDEDDEDDEDAE